MHWFGIKKTLKLGIKSLWMHRLRSTLTTLGIVFGVCSVIAMLAIGEGARRETLEAIARLGSTNLIVETVKPPEEGTDSGQVEDFDTSDYPKFVYEHSGLAERVRPILSDFLVLVVWNLVFFMAAYLSFLRYDVR